MSSGEMLLQAAMPGGHLVQLYESNGRLLGRNVSRYLCEGLKRGDGLVVIAATERFETLIASLKQAGADPDEAGRAGRLVFLDAREALSRVMVAGRPDRGRFESVIGTVISDMRARTGSDGLRVFGEIVGILWKAGQFSAAIRLERFWNELLTSVRFNLFCAYPIDVFSEQFQTTAVNALLSVHTHLLPAGEDGALEGAIELAMDDVLGPQGAELKRGMDTNHRPSWGVVPSAEAMVLWIRDNLPGPAHEILERARQYYVTSHLRLHFSRRGDSKIMIAS